jgi:hypothetical protein
MPSKRSIRFAWVLQMINITLNDMVRNYDDDRDARNDASMNVEEIPDRRDYTSKMSRREIQVLCLY